MADEWPKKPLCDLTESDTPVTYGVVKPGDEDTDGVLFIRGGDIADWHVLSGQLRTISQEISRQYKRTLLRGGEIVMSLVGNPGQVAIVPESLRGANIARQTALIRLRPDVDTRFVMYFLGSRAGQEALVAHSRGSVQQVINLRELKTVGIPTPPLSEQRAIANILGTLDDKIVLNRQMNETLEAMALALFKSWFVDFDPVRDKAEGRDTGLPKTIADLFPDTFEESVLGKIPRGWPARPLKEFLKEVNERVGGSDVIEYSSTNNGLQLRSERFTKKLSVSNANNKVVRKGCMVFGLSRRVLNFGLMRDEIGSVSPAYRVLAVDHSSIAPDFLERMMRIRSAYFYGAVSASSREGQSVSLDALGQLRIVQPSNVVQDAYYHWTETLHIRARALDRETSTLAALRDTLLPKLISGELRIKDAERFIGKGA